MFPYRKVLLSLLAPLGASTIVGTGFSVWVFSESFGDEVTSEADLDQVKVTPEITNGNLTINTVPDMVVFSEGMQGKNDLFDGINFYSNEEIDSGTKIIATFNDNDSTNRQMSLLYEKSFTDNSETLYFSMSETGSNGSLTLWTSKLTKKDSSVEGFYTTWIGSTVEQKENVTIVLNNDASVNNDASGTVSINNGTPLSFTFNTKTDENKPSITITNSEFSFRYTYDNPLFIDESETGYKLNIGLKFDLSSKEHRFSNITENGNTLSLSNTEINASISKQEDGSYLYSDETFSGTLTFTSDGSSQDSTFNSGTYEGIDKTKNIPITLIISNNGDAKDATLKIGSMDRFLCLVDALTSSSNPLLETQGEYEDYLFITNDENYASTNLHIDIEKHLDRDSPYIDYTCQLDEYIRYLNSEVKPYDFNKYLSLIESYNIGEWNFRITLVAFYTQESQEVGA